MTILIVDDEEDERTELSALLQRLGYAVQAVRNPLEAFRLIRATTPDLILLSLTTKEVESLEAFCHVAPCFAPIICHAPADVLPFCPQIDLGVAHVLSTERLITALSSRPACEGYSAFNWASLGTSDTRVDPT